MQLKARRSTRSTKAVAGAAVRSKVQSKHVTVETTEQDTTLPPDGGSSGPTGPAAQKLDLILETVEIVDQFDISFYASFYQDLQGLSDGELREHWARYGRNEGRFPNISTWLTAQGTPELPSDFSVNFYRNLNPDLTEQQTDYDFIGHYINFGRSEGRRYSATWDDVIDLLESRSSQIQEIRAKKLLGGDSLTRFLDKNGIYATEFFKLLDVGDYQARVGISRCADKLECIVHFVAEGQYQAIPIGSDYDLDEQVYSEFAPEVAGLSRIEIYRHWLNIGLRRGSPINALHLMKGIGLPNSRLMPSGFDWRAYLWSNPDLSGKVTTPWQALRHFITRGILESRPGCQATPSTAPFYIHVADQLAVQNELASARALYETALLADPLNTRGLRHHGDCLMRLGDFYGASIVYQRTIREGLYSAWTFLNLAACLKKLNRGAEAVNILGRLSQIMPDDQFIKGRFVEASEEYYYSVSSIANGLAASGLYEAGRRQMDAAVEVLASTVVIDKPLVSHKGSIRRVGIVADMSIPQCKYYRVLQKQEHLQLAGYQVSIFNQAADLTKFHKELPFLDAVLFYRVAALPPAVRAIRAARTAGLPTIYDIDDLIFDDDHFPDTFESYGGLISADVYAGLITGTALFKKAMALCDFSVASTKPLSELMQRLVVQKIGFVHPNALGQLEELFLTGALSARATLDEGRPVNVFYGTGTRAHNRDFELLAAPALLRLLKKHGPKIRVVVIGYLSLPQEFQEFECCILKISDVFDRERYFHLLSEVDINIAVLSAGVATDCKSEIKWMEAAMLGIPSVVSNTATYEDVVVNGQTGLIAANSEDWFRHLDALIQDPSLRRRIGDAAKIAVSHKYSLEVSARNIRTIFDRVESTLALREVKARLRVLIVHVFYPPPSYRRCYSSCC